MHGVQILFLEDDASYRQSVKEYLESEEFIVDTCSNGEEFINTIFRKCYDLYIIDINVPKLNGFEIMKMLRECSDTTMKLVLSSSKTASLRSFREGCDDFITKDVDSDELLVRVINLIKRAYHTYKDSISLNNSITYDVIHKKLYKNGFQIQMEQKTLEVLDYLIKNRGTFITKENLEKSIYSCCCDCKANVIRYHIHNLRKTIGSKMIESKYKRGYRLKPLQI